MSNHPIEKVLVVADEHESALLSQEELLQPEQALKVQMVGRFIHQKEIWFLHQKTRQRHAHAPTTRELLYRPLKIRTPEAHATQDRFGTRLQLIAARDLQFILYDTHPPYEITDVPVSTSITNRCLLTQPVQLLFRPQDLRIRFKYLIPNTHPGDLLYLLGQETHPQSLPSRHAAGICPFLFRQDPKKCGFPRTIGTNQAYAHARLDVKGSGPEHSFRPVTLPESAHSSSARIRRSVVFPAPLGPIKPMRMPGLT